jgi:hypothetical protein
MKKMNGKTNSIMWLAILCLVINISLHANPISPRWKLINNSAPARYAHGCVTDFNRHVIVLFGGKDSLGQMPSDTWEFSGNQNYNWNRFEDPGPEGRIGHGMWYDETDSVTLLFGGINQSGQYLNDTWVWNGQNWNKIDSTGPAPRSHFAYAYDRDRHRAVLYGGIGSSGLFQDTWEWDGTSWSQRAIGGPPPRIMASMSFYKSQIDSFCVLFGGRDGYDGTIYNDVWKWDGTTWEYVNTGGSPPQRLGQAMESIRYVGLVLFGGQRSSSLDSLFNDTWELYGGDSWMELTYVINKPTVRTQATLAPGWEYETILIGGRDSSHIFSQVWAYPVYYTYRIGDVNDSGHFTGLDVIYSVRFFKGGPPPPYSLQCTPGSTWYVAGDVNASCSFSGLDVTYMVRYFKGGAAPVCCPSCPPSGR